jgi:hypothetical protein
MVRVSWYGFHFLPLCSSPRWARVCSLSRPHDHTQTHRPRYDSSGRMIRPMQRLQPGNTHHSQQTATRQHAPLTTDCNQTTRATHNRLQPDYTHHPQQIATRQHAPLTTDRPQHAGGFRTHNPIQRSAADHVLYCAAPGLSGLGLIAKKGVFCGLDSCVGRRHEDFKELTVCFDKPRKKWQIFGL